MPKNVLPSSIKSTKSSLRYSLVRNRESSTGLYAVKMRITYPFGITDIPVQVNGQGLKCRIGDLNDNRFIPSVEINIMLQQIALKALTIADGLSHKVSATYFYEQLFLVKKKKEQQLNLFDLFGKLYDDPRLSVKTRGVLIRLFEFREHCKPSERVEDLNLQWLLSFFKFLHARGYYFLSTKGFNYKDYDRAIFFRDKPRQQYMQQTFNKYISVVKGITVSNMPYSLYKKGLIKRFDVDELKLSLFMKSKNLSGTRLQHNLRKEEIDHLLNFEFDDADLAVARDMFIMQTFSGGLRGFKEYSTLKLLKYSATEQVLSFYQAKVDKTIMNPMNAYTLEIIRRYQGKIPNITVSKNVDQNEQHYRERLRKVGILCGLDRMVSVDNSFQPIHDVFNPYWARKTFGTICYHHLNLRESEIALFTGHLIRGQSELMNSYVETGSIEHKKRLLANLNF
ncbi:hypothetical protein WBG78_28355 [Chryseolinea sp. T2]|uniref:hypothetical protein n=1 Tax=Chryseolinea sp. T2 TaxID=3129255 RepID=UPI00307755AA